MTDEDRDGKPPSGDAGGIAERLGPADEVRAREPAAVEPARLRRRARGLDAVLVRFSDAVRGLTDPTAVAESACRLVAGELGAERACWTEVDWSTREFVIGPAFHAPGLPVVQGRFAMNVWDPLTSLHLAGDPVVVNDTQADPRVPPPLRAAYAAIAVGADLSVPVLVEGRLRCSFAVGQSHPRRWTPEEVALVVGIAGRCWAEVERARAEAALRASEEQFRRSIEEAPIPIIMHAEDGTVLQVSRTWTELTGYTLDEVPTFDAWLTRAYGHGADAVRTHVHALFAGRERTMSTEFPVRARDGEVRHWSFSASAPGTLHDGRRFVVGMALDITERLRAQEASEREHAARTRDEMRRQLAEAEEVERRRLARELHDQLGQHLTGLSLGLADVRRRIAAGDSAEARLGQLEELARLMTRDARHLALELRPPELDDVGLESALRSYVEQWSARYGVAAEVAITGVGAPRLLPGEASTAIYRIVQEALTNVARHAGATRVSVVLDKPAGEARLIVEDDGRGFDVEAAGARVRRERRLGLASMRERLALIGGTLEVESSVDGGGTTVYARVPLPEGQPGAVGA